MMGVDFGGKKPSGSAVDSEFRMAKKKWPPPGFPLVEGQHDLTANWSIFLPQPFARRIEDGQLVLWRPGLTIWMAAWGNNHGQSQAERLAWVKNIASPKRFDERTTQNGKVTRFGYRLLDESENGTVESVAAMVISDDGHLQLSVYFDTIDDEAAAWAVVESVKYRKETT
jgi:hypothetical protein